MKKQLSNSLSGRIRILIPAGILAALVVASAYGQTTSRPQSLNVPHSFIVGGKVLPAGNYTVTHENVSAPWVTILYVKDDSITKVKIITQLARHNSDSMMRLVFDRVGNDYFLSEVWMPGQDGLLVRSTSEKHQHEIVKASS